MRLTSTMMSRSGGVTRTARTRYNLQSRGKKVGVEKRQARSIRQRCLWNILQGFVVTETLQEKLSTDNAETKACSYIQGLRNN